MKSNFILDLAAESVQPSVTAFHTTPDNAQMVYTTIQDNEMVAKLQSCNDDVTKPFTLPVGKAQRASLRAMEVNGHLRLITRLYDDSNWQTTEELYTNKHARIRRGVHNITVTFTYPVDTPFAEIAERIVEDSQPVFERLTNL